MLTLNTDFKSASFGLLVGINYGSLVGFSFMPPVRIKVLGWAGLGLDEPLRMFCDVFSLSKLNRICTSSTAAFCFFL